MKRIIALMLCLLCTMAVFAGCGEDENTPDIEALRVEELDGTVWPLTSQTYSDGTGFTEDQLNSLGLYGCISFSGGKYTLMLDTSPVTGEYNVSEDSIELVNTYTLTRGDNVLVLEMGGAALNFTYDSSLVPVAELVLDGTKWELTYMKNDEGVYNSETLASNGMSGTFTFDGDTFTMANDYGSGVNSLSGTYVSTQAVIELTVDGEAIYGFINGANLIIAEGGISMVYTICD